jgi:hypothetical protein
VIGLACAYRISPGLHARAGKKLLATEGESIWANCSARS